ncbi:MAG: TIGR00730 family Rossman fold protein [Gemmatimonadota bacterium]|nr:TIGR00730 family Rossman fold protein [Gemmatimonadota bacterium]
MLNTIGVFCASSPGADPRYVEVTRAFGTLAAQSGRRLVYGGGNTGLMGVLADAAMAAGGEVIGLMPKHLVDREVAHHGISELIVVNSMHERKARLADLAEAFVALPGGLGTLEEFTEIWTWGQLGLHAKPYGLLNIAGYYDGLLAFLDHAVSEGFFRPEHRAMVVVDDEPAALLAALEAAPPPAQPKYIDRATT